MSDKFKEVVVKTAIVISIASLLFIFPGLLIFCWFLSEKVTDIIFICSLIIFFVSGSLLIILLFVFGIKPKPVKSENMHLAFDTPNEFLDFLQNRLLQKEYKLQKSVQISPNGEVELYLKRTKIWTLRCFVIIIVPELSDELIETVNGVITSILTEYYDDKTITDTVDMISVFCVNHTSPAFRKLVNSNVQQGLKNGRLPVGVSFGGKNIYIAKQKDGFAITKYKRLKIEFMDIMKL